MMGPSTQYGLSANNQCDKVQMYELEDIKKHATADDCWVVYGKNVYDVTSFLSVHPGGGDLILREAGGDISSVLRDENIHVHTTSAYNILKEYKIGELNGPNVEQSEMLDINSNELVGWKEDMVDWEHGMVCQVHKFGREYIKWVHSPVNRPIKMFDNKFVEFFSNTPWYLILIVWVPVVLASIAIGYLQLVKSQEGYVSLPALVTTVSSFFTGLCVWTLLEYILHRYVFHLEPNGDSPTQITLHFFFHGLHHKVPFDGGRLVFPPTVATFFVAMYWYVLSPFCSGGTRTVVFAGGVFGYICYDMIHYYIHHGNPSEGSYFYNLKKYHVAHHFEDHNNGFGISSKFWDIIFDTKIGKQKLL